MQNWSNPQLKCLQAKNGYGGGGGGEIGATGSTLKKKWSEMRKCDESWEQNKYEMLQAPANKFLYIFKLTVKMILNEPPSSSPTCL